jgi:hypothetical protein
MKNNACKGLVSLALVCVMIMGVFAVIPGASAEEGYHYTVYYYDFNEAHVDLEATELHVWDEANGFDLEPVKFTEIVTLSDGRNVKAGGYGDFPDGYGGASEAIDAHFLQLLPEDMRDW